MKSLGNLTVLFLLLLANTAWADHLVGGEFQVTHVGNYTYDISLNVYGDMAGLTGPQGNEDQFVDVSFFNKQTNQLVETFRLPLEATDIVPYNNTTCQTGSVGTKLLVYQLRRDLLPSVYNSSGGYYLVWERCCRNAAISNIQLPQNSGLVYYAEFPAVLKNSQPFVNSMPVFPPMPPDYLCVQELYRYSMKANDADGDSLVYSLTVPLKGHTLALAGHEKEPGLAGPYAPVDWAAGYDLNTMIQGNPALSVDSRSGSISVKPTQAGLFVFAVKCEEFRNGVKIGEVRRDIQVKVNNCSINNKPAVQLNLPHPGLNYQEGDTLIVSKETNFCHQFTFTDPDVGQTVNLKVETENLLFKPQASVTSGTIVPNGKVFTGQLCWQACNLPNADSIFKVNLIIFDNACANGATDTLHLIVKLVRTINTKPNISIQGATEPVVFGLPYQFKVLSTDADNDQLTVQMQGQGFDPVSQGMKLNPVSGQGQVVSDFSWKLECGQEILPDGYELMFIVNDNSCTANRADTTRVRLQVLPTQATTIEFLPPNIFTPNNDGLNDLFVMPVLPGDNCSDVFQEIRIFNRWGMEVFQSASREFAWDGKNVSESTYYYLIRYKKRNYKGYVTIVH
jgi:gliding motility-associated-like protein